MISKTKFYHGSPVRDIKIIQPHRSNHGESWVYLSTKRENTVVYLSNAIEKFHKENHLKNEGSFYKWASYGFNKEGILVLEEYYPNATEETYKGVEGFIYCAEDVEDYSLQKDIPFAAVSSKPIKVTSFEYIPDAYEELLRLEKNGEIIISRYEETSSKKKEWIEKVIREDFMNFGDRPDYIAFLKGKFPFLNREVRE